MAAAAACSATLIPQRAGPSSCWLQRQQQHSTLLPSACANQQLVPRVPQLHSVAALHHAVQAGLHSSVIAAAAAPAAAPAAHLAAAPAAAAATPATQAPPDEAASSCTTRARLYALYEFVAAHGRLPHVQDSHQGVAVGRWAEKCRQLKQQQQGLEPDLAAALQTIPGWSWEPTVTALSDGFQHNLQQLVAYAREYGAPPMRIGRSATTSASAAAAAAAASVDSSTSSPSSSSTSSSASSSSASSSSASSSKGRAGRKAPPSAAQRDAAVAISKQLVEQRKRGVLTLQQIHAIADSVPGWRWDNRIRSPDLDCIIALLQQYHQAHGRLPKADERLPDGFLIGEWCMARRGEYSRGQLELDVAAALEARVPGWLWNRLDSVFEKNLEALGLFVAAHGRTPTQRETWDGVRVGAWCNKRRLQYKAGTLAADRVAALEAIPGWWWNCDQMP